MRDIEEVKALMKIIKKKEKLKSFPALTIYITNYYFSLNFDVIYIDKELLERMAMLFWLYVCGYLVCPYKRKKKTLKEIMKDIEEEMYEWKKATFNEWFFKNLPLTKKQVEEKKRSLRL